MNEKLISPDAERARALVRRAQDAFNQGVAKTGQAAHMTAAQAGALERSLRTASLELQAPWQSLHKMGYGDSTLSQRIKSLRAELDAMANGLGVALYV